MEIPGRSKLRMKDNVKIKLRYDLIGWSGYDLLRIGSNRGLFWLHRWALGFTKSRTFLLQLWTNNGCTMKLVISNVVIHRRIRSRAIIHDDLEGSVRAYWSGIFMVGIRKTMTNLDQDNRCPGRDSIQVPHEHRPVTECDGLPVLTGDDRCGTFDGRNLFSI
jgi:hypothetical protein